MMPAAPSHPDFDALVSAARRAPPLAAVVLGSGMGDVTANLRRRHTVPFAEVPGLGTATVSGHRGCLTLGTWAGKGVLVFEGRLHHYEGHTWAQVVLPVRIAHALGLRVLLLTNAAGGIRDDLDPGSLMAIADQLEWTRPFCWRLPGRGGFGPRRLSPYSLRLLRLLRQAGLDVGSPLPHGVYASVTGPSYETPAEIRALRSWGADAVGMSTAREIQTGHDLGLECAGLSLITNRASGLSRAPLDHKEVLTTAAARSERLRAVLERFLELL